MSFKECGFLLPVDQTVTGYVARSEVGALLERMTLPTPVQLLLAVTSAGVC